jgi:pSer/pThr/pTyr-binding forkhead associated (FHA) protein
MVKNDMFQGSNSSDKGSASESNEAFELLLDEADPIPIPAEGLFIVGRGGDSLLVLDDPAVSNHHCMFIRKSGKLEIRDLGSGHGTFVNHERIHDCEVFHGDQVTVGPFAITIHGQPSKAERDTDPADMYTDERLPSFSEILLGKGSWDLEEELSPVKKRPAEITTELKRIIEPKQRIIEPKQAAAIKDEDVGFQSFIEDSQTLEATEITKAPKAIVQPAKDKESRRRVTEPYIADRKSPSLKPTHETKATQSSPKPMRPDSGCQTNKERPRYTGAILRIHCGKDSFQLSEGGVVIVGRHSDCDFQLRNNLSMISRRHMQFQWFEDQGPQVFDRGSQNGIALNGRRVTVAAITAGDVVRLGPVKFLVKDGD